MTARIWIDDQTYYFDPGRKKGGRRAYILATPATLAASPEVQALIAAERERCVEAIIATCDAEIFQAKELGPTHVPIITAVKHDCIAAIRAGTEGGE